MSAATSKLAAVNLALAHLSEDPTDTLGDTARGIVRKLLPFIDIARDLELSAHGWQEALEYSTLTADPTEPTNWKYKYHFILPGDCLRIWQVATPCVMWTAGKRIRSGAERHVIRSDSAGPLDVAYVRRLGWDGIGPQLLAAIAAHLASLGAGSIQGDEGRAARLRGLAAEFRVSAAGRDGTQQGGQDVPFPSRLKGLRQSAS